MSYMVPLRTSIQSDPEITTGFVEMGIRGYITKPKKGKQTQVECLIFQTPTRVPRIDLRWFALKETYALVVDTWRFP